MRNFKFFNTIDENDAIEPIGRFNNELNLLGRQRFNELASFIPDEPMVPYQSETPQVYTQMFRMEIPLNQLSEDQRNHLKISNENMILNQLSNTLDFRHEVIHQDENGFTLRTELFI